MIGEYRFYKSGQLVHTQPNVITTAGKSMIIHYLAGSVQSWAGAIAVGSIGIPATVGDTQLGFEYGRSDIQLRSPRYVPAEGTTPERWEVVFRSQVDPLLSGYVYETGLFNLGSNAMSAYPRMILTTFNPNENFITGGDAFIYTPGGTTNFMRVGEYTRLISADINLAGAPVVIGGLNADFSGYRPSDVFSLTYHQEAANATSFEVRLETDDANYYTSSFVPGTGYQLQSIQKSAFTATGAPDWQAITSIRFIVTAGATAANVYMDALSIDDKSTSPEYTMVSRTTLTTPILKTTGEIMDIEYVVNLLG